MVDAGPEPTYAEKIRVPPPGHALRNNHLCAMHALSITLSTSVYYGHYSQVCTLVNNDPPRANMSSRLPNLAYSATETSYNIKILHRISLPFE